MIKTRPYTLLFLWSHGFTSLDIGVLTFFINEVNTTIFTT